MESFDSSLRQFWEIDSVPQTSSEKSESIEAEEQFKNTTVRTESGRYMVQLPFKENLSLLENNRSSAVQQYYSLEKKMKSDQNLKDQYNNIIKEYLDLGIVEIVPYEELSEKCYYFPHHCVVKSQAVSTKVRIVFNASSRSRSGLSLNDVLKVGPVVQPELVSVLWRFRVGAVALTCDIVKMYLQTLLYPPHRDFQRFVWRESPDERLKDLRFRTVCFGVKSSPYLATRSLVQLAMEEGEKYATAAQVIQNNFYIDDCLVSAPSVSHMEIIKNELIEVLKSGGMELSKFNSNVPEIMQHTSENILPLSEVPISDQQTKTLGMIWCPRTDMFQFKINVDHSEKITKRSILSMLARIFDPIGLLGPILTQARLIFQETWILKLDWDSELGSRDDEGSAELRERWIQFREDLAPLESMEIPRWISNIQFPTRMEIHGFSDASGDAYGAAVYVVCEDAIGNRSARLLTSKSKITPLKQGKHASTFTIPKAELCGALMAATLVKTVSSSLEAEHCFFWCDATVVLHQIHSPHGKREVFVTRRVTDILKVSEAHQWRHVPTKENPADLISRGAGSQQLIDSELWWNGPSWLSQSSDQWPPAFVASSRLDVGSCVTSRVEVSKGRSDDVDDYPSIFEHLITRCSRFQRMKRILAQVLAIVQFWGTTTKRTTRSSKKVSDYPLNNYLSDAELLMLRWNQSIYLSEGLRAVQFNKLESNPKVRYLLKLKPFLDNKCILRVGGRLHFSHESKDVKHPIIIPKSPLAKLIIKEEHERLLHAGPQLLLSSLRQKYWPIDGRNATRKIVRECMVCTRANPRVQEQVMGSLPEHRVTHVRPFMAVGLDFAGPLLIRKGIRRDSTDKAYVAVFVCLSVRAVHLELVSSLHTDNFIAALRRFVARRGIPSHIYSDNGRTFVGADNELKRLLQSSDHQELVARQCEEMSIEWRFQPPYAPHHGGLWEAAVKSFKYHLKRIAGNVIMTFEELSTLLIQIEAVLNSRPLTPVTENVEDLNVLTPGSFLIGRPLCQIPDPDLGTEKYGCLKRWQLCQKISQDLSRRWKMEYLHNLQQRAKWCKSHADLKVGDLVLVKNDQSPSTIWPMGRVIQTFPGIDQRVRVVEIKTSSGIIKRPISQLVKLPFDENPE
ncbi:uncharacterized protein LOC129810293 [Phlebotomus papatasi]|uniref:uncharacterized protein LOC129810293 n=1 Tax=Phlebotomus papatasi TaxID=29031 RepID=UPI00248381D9|nr:uncharacterized protein LOC129810293 [Phlebotomus papatasi]